jgi:hypothetical protein
VQRSQKWTDLQFANQLAASEKNLKRVAAPRVTPEQLPACLDVQHSLRWLAESADPEQASQEQATSAAALALREERMQKARDAAAEVS